MHQAAKRVGVSPPLFGGLLAPRRRLAFCSRCQWLLRRMVIGIASYLWLVFCHTPQVAPSIWCIYAAPPLAACSPLSAREGEPICRYLLQLIFASLRLQISLSCQYFSFIPHPLKISLGDSKNCLRRKFLLS